MPIATTDATDHEIDAAAPKLGGRPGRPRTARGYDQLGFTEKECPRCTAIARVMTPACEPVMRPVRDFPMRTMGRLQSHCHQCKNATQHAKFANSPGYRAAFNRANTEATRERAFRNREYLTTLNLYCVDCFNDERIVVEFDHVRGTKAKTVSVLVREGASLERLQEEVAKCEPRCANCHRIKTAVQQEFELVRGDVERLQGEAALLLATTEQEVTGIMARLLTRYRAAKAEQGLPPEAETRREELRAMLVHEIRTHRRATDAHLAKLALVASALGRTADPDGCRAAVGRQHSAAIAEVVDAAIAPDA